MNSEVFLVTPPAITALAVPNPHRDATFASNWCQTPGTIDFFLEFTCLARLRPMAHQRLFIAFDTPPEVKSRAIEIQNQLRRAQADVSWERQEKLHCTIKFLGDTPSELTPAIADTLLHIGRMSAPFSVRYIGTGCFPNNRDPHVLWLGIENPDGRLKLLFETIESAVNGYGFKPENRPFHPHLTLGRVRSGRNHANLLRMLENVTFESAIIATNEILLIKSELKPAGSVYTKIKSVPLVGNLG
jgi:RNA 2',3'-cyclic 3'-phosphodiesterase